MKKPLNTEVSTPMNSSADLSGDLRRARKQFLTVGSLDPVNLCPGVPDSLRRSRDLRVHPDRVDLPFVREPDTDSPLMHAAAPFCGGWPTTWPPKASA